jgi:mannose-6-phosphate isomerase-like protein (cupin superfamily)
MGKRSWLAAACAAGLAWVHGAAAAEVQPVLERLARAYEHDRGLVPATFGVEVDGQAWTVTATGPSGVEPASVVVAKGAPAVPTFAFATTVATFNQIATGRISLATALAAARDSDRTPVDLKMLNGFKPGPDFRPTLLKLAMEFWNPTEPRTVDLGFDHALPLHGAHGVIVHYAPGLRTLWAGLAPGDHANADARDQVNEDFDTLVIVMKAGSARARIDGREIPLKDEQALKLPAGVSHEFWNPGPKPAEFLLVMFGPGA